MYKINDIVIYRRNVCKIIAESTSERTGEQCYVMVPYRQADGSTKMRVPVSNKGGHLRNVMTKQQIDDLIQKTPSIEQLPRKAANMKSQYSALLGSDSVIDLVRIIKTSWSRNQARAEQHKKIASIDDEYLQKAEHYLYEEISVALNTDYDHARDYFLDSCEKAAMQNA